MRHYKSGNWGFGLVLGIRASVFPYAFAVAVPNACLTICLTILLENDQNDSNESKAKNAAALLATFTAVMFFVLYFRSNIAYDRWWEGGTLLQKTRGEWFNAYSSLLAMSSTDPARADEVEAFHHMLARLMSMLFCCALQQVTPEGETPYEILDPDGIGQENLDFLEHAQDKVEVLLQWIQRATVQQINTGILPVAPPILSRAFQEVSRGIVNLQNARKIADFPFPFPYAQASMVMLLVHWCAVPFLSVLLFQNSLMDKVLSAALSFLVIFFVWCINFIALQLEQPFGSDSNDLPMADMQKDWNKSLGTLLARGGQHPPMFAFNHEKHRQLKVVMSDQRDATQTMGKVPTFVRTMSVDLEKSHDPAVDQTVDEVLCATGADYIIGGPQLFQSTRTSHMARRSSLNVVKSSSRRETASEPRQDEQIEELSPDKSPRRYPDMKEPVWEPIHGKDEPRSSLEQVQPEHTPRSSKRQEPKLRAPISIPKALPEVLDIDGNGNWSLYKPKNVELPYGAAGMRGVLNNSLETPWHGDHEDSYNLV